MNNLNIHPVFRLLTLMILSIGMLILVYSARLVLISMPLTVYLNIVAWLALAILAAYLMHKQFVIGYLTSLFCMLIAWRLAALYNIDRVSYTLFPAFIIYFISFIDCAYRNVRDADLDAHRIPLAEWQLIFIRLYIGFNFVPHFTEKLFAGAAPRLQDVNAFMHLGVPAPEFFVILAGLCELGAAIALGLGLMMRIGAIGTVLYLLIATYLGHHFSLGFIWAGPGGGWEYATMWAVLILSFAISGVHRFSIDQYLESYFKLPSFIKKCL